MEVGYFACKFDLVDGLATAPEPGKKTAA